MSGESSIINVPSSNVGDVQPAAALQQQVGAPFRATPTTAADGESQSFRIRADGSLVIDTDAANPLDVTVVSPLPAGTNNIGDVDVLSLPSIPAGTNNIGDVDVLSLPALPAGTNNIGDVDVLSLPSLPSGTNNIGDVDVVSSALPTGAATQATLASLLTELQAKADLAETQPVSAAALPLPTGAATQATLASLLTELQAKADLAETQPVSAAALPLPTGAATETTLDAVKTAVEIIDNAIAGTEMQVDVVAQLPAGSNILGQIQLANVGAQTVKQAQVAVGTSAVRLTTDGAAPSGTRFSLSFRPDPNSAARFFYGGSGVTTANGHEVFPGESIPREKDSNDYFIISDTAAQTVHVVEVE